MRPYIGFVAAYLVASCARPDYAQQWPGRATLTAGPQLGYSVKRVVGKERAGELLADDGSVCRTSAERYEATAVGRWISCDWKQAWS
jgi:hypothetical protein